MSTDASNVFPEPAIPRESALGWVEPSVHWYTAITRPEALISRRNVNEWFHQFPDEAKDLLRTRLRSESNVDHLSALDELFVHHLLRQRFDDVRYEEGGKGPDFRLYRQGELILAVEVASLFMRQDWDEANRRFGQIADDLNKRVRLSRYFVHFEPEVLTRQPRMRQLAAFVARTIEALPDPAAVVGAATTAANMRDVLPTAVYEEPGVRVRFEFLPRKAETEPDADDRIVGMGPMTGGWVNSGGRLKSALTAKAGGRYDIGDAPYIVGVLSHDPFCSIDQVEGALYGSERVTIPAGDVTRSSDGLFGVDRQRRSGRNTRVSAIWVVEGFMAWNPGEVRLLRFDNPYAARPVVDDLVPANFTFGVVERDAAVMRLGWKPAHPNRSLRMDDAS
jgi:hypothetical protein